MPFEHAKWIQGGFLCESPLFRKIFRVEKPVYGDIKICGLGFFELYINGQKISSDVLVPAWSNYEPRTDRRMLYPINDTFRYRTYYLEYDISPYLKNGTNVLGVRLGNGWYNQHERNIEGDFAYAFPKLCFLARITDNQNRVVNVISDESVVWHESEILFNNIYFGETHDLRKCCNGWNLLEYEDSCWQPSLPADTPLTNLYPQRCPPDKVIRRIQPSLIYADGDQRIYDCGENITGYAVMAIAAEPGAVITVTYSEEYDATAHRLDYRSAGGEGQIQTDRYISGNTPCECHPRFCWHGFRYFEVNGPLTARVKEVNVIHGDMPVTSTFECSNPTLNWLYNTYIRTQLGNIHCGVPSDCPHRERLGYTGDGQLVAQSAMLCLDVRALYDKWMADIADGQDLTSGHIQHTAPFYGGGGGPGGWGAAVYLIPWHYYRHYGDRMFLEKYMPPILLWLDYMDSRAPDGLVIREEEGGWCLGEWCAPDLKIPADFVNTYFYIQGIRIALLAVKHLEKRMDTYEWENRLQKSENALRKTYMDNQTGSFCGGVNGADAFAVSLGLGDERTVNNLLKRYRTMKKLDTGIFGTDILLDILFRYDPDLACDLLTGYSQHSFERMRREGATTFWETWGGEGSHNHPMFGSVVRFLFTHILGIKQHDDSIGFENVTVQPTRTDSIEWARGSIETPAGRITVDWIKGKEPIVKIQ